MTKTFFFISISALIFSLSCNQAYADYEPYAGPQVSDCETEQLTIPYTRYFGISAGPNFLQFAKNQVCRSGGYVAIFGGIKSANGICVEAENAYLRNKLDIKSRYYDGGYYHSHATFQFYSTMINVLIDIPLLKYINDSKVFQPYVGAGIGFDFCGFEVLHYSNWQPRLAYQVMAGVSYSIRENVDLSIDYKFHRTNKTNNNMFGLGLRYYLACP